MEPLLELSTKQRERLRFLVDGRSVELASIDDLGINQRRRLARAWDQVRFYERASDDLTELQARDYDALVSEIASIVLPSLSPEEIEALGPEQREAVASAFFSNRLVPLMTARLSLLVSQSRSTTATSLLDSSASTDQRTRESG